MMIPVSLFTAVLALGSPPTLRIDAPSAGVAGEVLPAGVDLTGVGDGERVYVVLGFPGESCTRRLGGACVDIGRPFIRWSEVVDGRFDVAIPADSSPGDTLVVQTFVIRGYGGRDSVVGEAHAVAVVTEADLDCQSRYPDPDPTDPAGALTLREATVYDPFLEDLAPVTCETSAVGGGWQLFVEVTSPVALLADTVVDRLGLLTDGGTSIGHAPSGSDRLFVIRGRDMITGETFQVVGTEPVVRDDELEPGAFDPSAPGCGDDYPWMAVTTAVPDLQIGATGVAFEPHWVFTLSDCAICYADGSDGYEIVQNYGVHGTLAGVVLPTDGFVGCGGGTPLGLYWVPLDQRAPAGCGYTVSNTMEAGQHMDCNNVATTLEITSFQAFWR